MADPRWLDRDAAAAHLHVRPDDLRRLVKNGKIPSPTYHLGPRQPRWDRLALDSAMTGGVAGPASASTEEAVNALVTEIAREGRRR